MFVKVLEAPTEDDWLKVKQRALVTVGKDANTPPTKAWKHAILKARHSPIRKLWFSFYIECPYWVSVHLCRHVHAQPYVQSQRNDRQSRYDRDKAQQNTEVKMILDVNAEELMVIANKRLCAKAAPETRNLVEMLCAMTVNRCPEFADFLVPMCVYQGNVCHEMYPCGRCDTKNA